MYWKSNFIAFKVLKSMRKMIFDQVRGVNATHDGELQNFLLRRICGIPRGTIFGQNHLYGFKKEANSTFLCAPKIQKSL